MRRLLILLALLIWPLATVLGATLNAGFAQGLWYSSFPIFAGDEVRVYAALQNRSAQKISGEVAFFVNDKLAQTVPFEAASDKLAEASFNWRAAAGKQNLRAELRNLKRQDGSPFSVAELSASSAAQSELFVDNDFDQDRLGDNDDPDDDNDGYSDRVELAAGSDPREPRSLPPAGSIGASNSTVQKISEAVGLTLAPLTPSPIRETVDSVNDFFEKAATQVENKQLDLAIAAKDERKDTPLLKEQIEEFNKVAPVVNLPVQQLPQRGPWLALASDALGLIAEFIRGWWAWLLLLGLIFGWRTFKRRHKN